ncbi:hypothetical protein [Mucilaginibacter sp. BT774]|uniref:hypothetical protein n=1 Tax=Mucilaginibacter sp. BT774 TaxID=3062276 RepID=UPI002676060B|nr:hypothetical protein [Mucilaginibacter sp. BT774]MDO3626393.1 hypothetical protein [Mucilaginibacter sp. BT774]
MKGLPLILLKTIIIAILISIAVNCIYYAILTRSAEHDYGHAVSLIMESTFFVGIIIAVMSLPMLFLYYPNYWNSTISRLLLYFEGSILFIIAVFFVATNPLTKTSYLLTGTVFFFTNCIFYYRLTRKKQASAIRTRE